MHETIPETELPLTVAATGLVYQPFESGDLDGVTSTAGPEPSYWNGAVLALVVLPALSVQLPSTLAVGESGPE